MINGVTPGWPGQLVEGVRQFAGTHGCVKPGKPRGFLRGFRARRTRPGSPVARRAARPTDRPPNPPIFPRLIDESTTVNCRTASTSCPGHPAVRRRGLDAPYYTTA